jgi:hypothetical protein
MGLLVTQMHDSLARVGTPQSAIHDLLNNPETLSQKINMFLAKHGLIGKSQF